MKFLPLDRVTKIVSNCSPVARIFIASWIENSYWFARVALCLVKRSIGIFYECDEIGSIVRRQRNSNGYRTRNLRTVYLERNINGPDNLLTDSQSVFRPADIRSDKREFVAGETGNAIIVALV